jgi:ABC-type nitrate/sulfonate/bicarbonate transport system substrate-binding protein
MSRLAGLRHSALFLPFVIAVLALIVAACSDKGANTSSASGTPGDATPPSSTELTPKKLTFMAGFKPQANLPFVGAYVAQEKGFFKELNLTVDIKHAQSGEHLQLLLAGEVQVSTANAGQVVQRASEGLPLVAVALIGQKSEQGFAVGANSGINTVKDFAGKKLGYKGSVPVEFLALAKANGLNPDDVDQVKVSFDPRVLSEGQVNVLSVFISNEPGQLERIGYPVKVFDPSDYGIPALGLTYIASQDGINKDPDAIQRFVTAALKGIAYAADHPDEALDIVMKYAPQENRDQQRFMLNTELARAKTPATTEHGYGWQTTEQWQALAGALNEFKIIEKPVDVSKVFTTRFLAKQN